MGLLQVLVGQRVCRAFIAVLVLFVGRLGQEALLGMLVLAQLHVPERSVELALDVRARTQHRRIR